MRHSLAIGLILAEVLAAAASRAAPTSGPSVSYHVSDADGRPAAGAIAVLVPTGHSVRVSDGQAFDDDPAFIRATAGDDGELSFSQKPDQSLLVILHPSGWTVHKVEDQRPSVVLTRWSAIHGRRVVNNKPATGRTIDAWSVQNETTPYDPDAPTALFISSPVTDDAGEFTVDRACSGSVEVADATVYKSWGGTLDRPLIHSRLEPGQTAQLTLGGPGRSIVGRVNLPAEIAARDDWEFVHCGVWQSDVTLSPTTLPTELQSAPMSRQLQWWEAFARNQTDADRQQAESRKQAAHEFGWAHSFPFDMRDDGTFAVDGVPSGKYAVELSIRTKRVGEKRGTVIAQARVDVVVPAGDDASPVVVPPIQPQPVTEAKVGDAAPQIDVPGLDDQPISLTEYRGQIVLLDFWATWCGPCVAEMPELKSIYDRFGANHQIVMIGLSCDDRPDLPAEFVRSHDLRWRQGYLGGEDNPVQKAYGVNGIPSVWLIGRDGRVIARDLRDEKTAAAIERALGSK